MVLNTSLKNIKLGVNMKIDMSTVENIRERNEKVYILADESLHAIIGPLKHDIEYLLDFINYHMTVTGQIA